MEDLLRRAASGEGSYHKKTSRVYNPNHHIGESRMSERDEAAGMETVELSREMGDQRVSVTKRRNLRTNEENTMRDLRHVASDGVDDFDRRWTEASQRTLTGYGSAALEAPPQAPDSFRALPPPQPSHAGAYGASHTPTTQRTHPQPPSSHGYR